jgi:hypothetical protein
MFTRFPTLKFGRQGRSPLLFTSSLATSLIVQCSPIFVDAVPEIISGVPMIIRRAMLPSCRRR